MRCHLEGSSSLHLQDVLRLSEVSSCALVIKTSSDEPATRSAAVSTGHQCEIHLEADFLDCHVTKDTRRAERRTHHVFEVSQHAVVEREVGNVVHTVRRIH